MALSICQKAAWLVEYLHELTVFPKGKHNDQVDPTAQMLDWFKRGGQEPQDWLWQSISEPRRAARAYSARAVVGDGKAARHPPAVVTTAGNRRHCRVTSEARTLRSGSAFHPFVATSTTWRC